MKLDLQYSASTGLARSQDEADELPHFRRSTNNKTLSLNIVSITPMYGYIHLNTITTCIQKVIMYKKLGFLKYAI